jgi:CRP-like cAMP-binding protein
VDKVAQVVGMVNAIAPVPAAELRAFIATGTAVRLEPREYFCAPGERQHRIGFLHRGLVRYHVITDSGRDVTKDFSPSGQFTVSFGSAVMGEPARVAVSAVEECELTVWSWASMRAQLEQNPAWERFARRIAEWLYVRKEQRELSFLLQTATERYAEAAKTFGPAVVRIPQYQLASYLGIAPESLSRLRRRLASSGRRTG